MHSHYGASLLKLLGRNIIAQFLTKTNFIHFTYFRIVLDQSLIADLLFGVKSLLIISFEPILGFSYAHIHIQACFLSLYSMEGILNISSRLTISKDVMPNNKSLLKLITYYMGG